MNRTVQYAFFILGSGLLLGISRPAYTADKISSYRLIKEIPLPGDGGWDCLTLDAEARRLYVSHNIQVHVVDIDRYQLVDTLPDTVKVHGIALSPDRGFATNGRLGTVTIFDRSSLKVLGTVAVGENPDAILYDPASKQIMTFNGGSRDATAFEAASGRVVGRIPLDGKPEFAVADGQGTVYVDLLDKGELASLDSRQLNLKHRWPLAPCESPTSLAMDTVRRRLFVGCRNQRMAVVDADNGHVLTTLPIGEQVDATIFDPQTLRIFNANGDGTVTVVKEDSTDTYHVLGNIKTQKGARTAAFDPKTLRLFLVTAKLTPSVAPTADRPHPPMLIMPGTFKVLVYGQKKK